jgi:hypothetical protein
MRSRPPGFHGAHRRLELESQLGRWAVASAIARGELRTIWTGVVVDHRLWNELLTRAAAALLLAGTDAALCGPTAAALHGCRSIESADVHIVVRPGHILKKRPGLVVRRVGFYTDDVVEIDGLRALALDRVTSDLLCSGRPAESLALADEVLMLSGDDHEIVRKRIAEKIRTRQDPRGTVAGALLLDLASPHSRSPAESWLRWGLYDAGFPIPEVNWKLIGLDGVLVYVLDLAWPSLRIAVEYDGYAAHVGRREIDRARQDDLHGRDWIVVRADKPDLGNPTRFHRELRAAFARRGYTW